MQCLDFPGIHFDFQTQKYYHPAIMCAAAVVMVIDSLEFARAGRQMSGRLPVAGFTRISDLLMNGMDDGGTLDYTVVGASDGQNQPRLNLQVAGMLHLQCQRCLGPLDYRVAISNTLNLAPPGSPMLESDDTLDVVDAPDCIEASAELDVVTLVEDEVLLDLPPHPRHADGMCVSGAASYEAKRDGDTKFAGLAALKNFGINVKE